MARFLEDEKVQQVVFKQTSQDLSALAQADGLFMGKPRPFCLPTENNTENIFGPARAAALDYFSRHGITWHQECAKGPSNHLCDSQVCCVNFLFPLSDKPERLLEILSPHYQDLQAVLPIEESGEFLAFEFIGSRNYLGEKVRGRERTRGANCTSTDAAALLQTKDGRRHLVLIEWKYTESYAPTPLHISRNGTDRTEIYRPLFDSEDCPFDKTELSNFRDLFYDPFDQMMRQQFLANEMEKARELEADVVSVLHIAPACNPDFQRITSPNLVELGNSATDVWSNLLRCPDRFKSVTTEMLFAPLLKAQAPEVEEWQNYIKQRYAWIASAV